MTISFSGYFISFARDQREATRQLAIAVLSAIHQSYPERM